MRGFKGHEVSNPSVPPAVIQRVLVWATRLEARVAPEEHHRPERLEEVADVRLPKRLRRRLVGEDESLQRVVGNSPQRCNSR